MTSQTIFRVKHEKNYTIASNDFVRNGALSIQARFLHISLIGLPKTFKVTIRGLAKVLKLGKALIGNALNELIKHGYVVREQVREQGRIREWITKVFERPNLDTASIVTRSHSEAKTKVFQHSNLDTASIVTRSHSARSGSARSRELGHIEIKDQTNYGSNKENIKTPPTSSELPAPREEESKNVLFLGIKSSPHILATFGATVQLLKNAITDCLTNLAAAVPPVEKPTINDPMYSVDNQDPIATASVLRRLSQITGEGVECLRTNLGLQKTLKAYARNLEGVLEYLEAECKSRKVGVGFVVMALREGRKPAKAGGSSWKEWADRAFDEKLLSYSAAEGNDIRIVFKNGESLLWSEVQKLSWDAVRAIALEDKF